MRTRLIAYILSAVLRQLDPDSLKEVLDDMIDKVEDRMKDNLVAMKAIGMMREVLSIPDDIGGDED